MGTDTSETTLTDKAIAAYWGLAVGDALGATVEFMTPREIQYRYGVHDSIRGGGWLRLKKGQVTDDTEMALALGRAILQQGRLDARSVAQHFDSWLRGKPVDVGQTVRQGIIHYRRTGMPEVAMSDNAGNGACMRLLPAALLTLGHSQEEIKTVSCQQAHVTHHNVLSDAACETVIHLIHGALYGADKVELLHGPVADLIAQHPEFNFRASRMDNPTGYIVETMCAVFQSFMDTDSFRDCLIDVVNRGGDADTTGAIAGMIAGAYYGLPAIPTEWLSVIDPQVRASCRNQAKSILNLSVSDRTQQQSRKMEAGI
jgi:ADP-ribosyl-[dinitrogen reductase] hydrolase